MASLEARREARRQKILRNSENRLNQVLGNPVPAESEKEPVSLSDVNPEVPADNTKSSSDSASPTPESELAEEDLSTRTASTEEWEPPLDFNPPDLLIRQRAQAAAAQKTSLSREKTDSSNNSSPVLGAAGKTDSSQAEMIRVLDLMRCSGCLMAAFLSRWALGFGLGMFFFELAIVPFVLLEGALYLFQTTHMKDLQLPHSSSMLNYALILSGVKAELLTKYNMIMGYIGAVTEDFALFLFTFLLSHAVLG